MFSSASRYLRLALPTMALTLTLPAAEAALTINATRIIHTSDSRSSSVLVANPTNRPFAVQTWVNTLEDDTLTSVPLMPTPVLFRLDAGKEQTVQINNLPNTLPQDRESLFFFNVQEIPQQVEVRNSLNIAMRTRIKLFYRPSQLSDSPESQLERLSWSLRQHDDGLRLVVNNPTPFHYTFDQLQVSGAGQSEKPNAQAMAMPFTEQSYRLTSIRPQPGLQVTFNTINDYGASTAVVQRPLVLMPAK
ncbi:fimbrial biogenesis chaperone [Pseudomonas monteilii]|uniref:fimbrial biogenesis chaperone n=1 Tax=Pseudomonas alabamensis TaxID=3064349 RepID=UPI0027143904|nr:molecular chaperone [Pseudomonas sp. 22-AL-CL-001]MDO7912673.1 molecular chaperone [Pseudomonas sp. 22-AL-CL-001]